MSLQIQTPKPRQALRTEISRPSREKSENRCKTMLWLDKNENTDPLYIDFINKIILDIPSEAVFGYPDCFALYKKLAEHLQTHINQLIFSAGSDGIIRSVYETFVSPGDTVIYTEPTFAMYSLYTQMYGANSLKLHYEPSDNGPVLRSDTIIDAIQKSKPRLVCLPNPNSPSGTVFSPDSLRAIIKTAALSDSVILIDEAYYPFYPETCLTWVNEFPNLIIARTFSKAWGLAGIRIGFGIACKDLISELHKIRPMYEAGALSIVLAERILDYPEAMLASVQRLNDGKNDFLLKMKDLGLRTFHSEGNFLHVAFDQYAQAIHQALEKKVLYRKDFQHPSLSGYSRFTATTRGLFSPIIEKISAVVKGGN